MLDICYLIVYFKLKRVCSYYHECIFQVHESVLCCSWLCPLICFCWYSVRLYLNPYFNLLNLRGPIVNRLDWQLPFDFI